MGSAPAGGAPAEVIGMRRLLVVANQTLAGEHLLARLTEELAAGPCAIHVLVPASPDPQAWSHSGDDDRAVARARLARARDRFARLGAVQVSGEIGDPRPIDAILDVLRREQFDEVILSTLPPSVSRWLRMDLVSKVRRAVDIPVSHLIATPERVR